MTALVRPFNLSGHPALTLPLQTDSGRPAGLQLVGRRHADAALCAVARRLLSNLRHDLTLGEQLCN
jgi:amidase